MSEAAVPLDPPLKLRGLPLGSYQTPLGTMFQGRIEDAVKSRMFAETAVGKTNLVFTSPPFPLTSKKRYGNKQGEEYLAWLEDLATDLASLLAPDGSLVMEIGNSWEPGRPVMSTLPLQALLRFTEASGLHLCQQFICHNPTRLPGPAQWVNIERIRVKDSYTHVWWLAKSERPKADNRRVLVPYKKDMRRLLKRGKYNTGERPSGHVMREGTFLKDNGGSIPPSVLEYSNTGWHAAYVRHCRRLGVKAHPARMHPGLAEFFIRFLTEENDLVVDPFGGSNTTGAVAEKLGRRWLCTEPVGDYVRASRSRFDAVL